MSANATTPVPYGYETPPFPSLYLFVPGKAYNPQFLYHIEDVWRFTLFWTIIVYECCHLAASACAFAVQWRSWKLMWIVPFVYMIVAGLEAVLAGTIVGLM